jgi:hypothetical protein
MSEVEDVQFAIEPDNTLPVDNGDTSRATDIHEGKTNEDSAENGNSSNGEEKEANDTSRATNVVTRPAPPPVVNPWNKNTRNARNSTEKGRARFRVFASLIFQMFMPFHVL